MKNNRLLQFLLTCLLMLTLFNGSLLGAEAKEKTEAAESWAHEKSDLNPDKRVIWGKLDNGVRYAIMPNTEPPGKVSLKLLINSGSFMEEDDQRGLAHYLEHMAFNGVKNFPGNDLVEYFQRIGMAFGAHTNAYTTFDRTVYMLELPESNGKNLKDGMQVFRDYVDGMLLEEDQIDKERGVILSELRDRLSPERKIWEDFAGFSFANTLVPVRFPIGIESVIKEAKRDRFVRFYKDWYRADKVVIVVVGDVNVPEVEALIKKDFESLPIAKNPRQDPDIGTVKHEDVRARVYIEKEAAKTEVGIYAIKPYEKEIDTRAYEIREVKRKVGYKVLNQRLDELRRKDDAPFSEGESFHTFWFDKFEFSGIELETRPEQWEAALRLAEKELRRMLQYGFTQSEFEEAKAKLINQAQEKVFKASTRRSTEWANDLHKKIADEEVFISPETELEIVKEALASATPEECLELFRNSWTDANTFTYMSGNENLEKQGATSEKALAIYKESAVTPVEPPREQVVPAFAYQNFGKPGKIVDETFNKELKLHEYRFANNVRLNVMKTDFATGEIYIYVRFGGGELELPSEKEGLKELASNVFVEGGLGEHSRDELKRIFAGKTIKYDFTVNRDAFVLASVTNKRDLADALDLLAAYVQDPGYRMEALRLAHKSFEEKYDKMETTPEGVLGTKVDQFLASGDKRFGVPDKQVLFSRTMQEVKDWLLNPLAKGYIEITIVGDLDLPETLKDISTTFGAFPARKKDKTYLGKATTVEFPTGVHVKEFEIKSDFDKAIAEVVWPSADIWDIEQARKLSLLASILSDRLRKDIRESDGSAYSTFAYNDPSEVFDGYGRFVAIAWVSPEKAEDVSNRILNIGTDLAKNGITEDEFERAIKPLLTQIDLQQRKNSYWLGALDEAQVYPQKVQWAIKRRKMYENFTIEEINQIAKKFLKKDKAIRILVVPKKKDEEGNQKNEL